jgi:hypothetical protein
MRRLAVERVEAVRKGAQSNSVEREARHVGGDVDILVRVEPRPFLDQLGRQVAHLRQIAADRLRPERRRQDVVRLLPVRLVRPGREQAVADDRPHLHQAWPQELVEALVVAHFVDELEAREHEQGASRNLDPKDRAVGFGELDNVEERGFALQVEQVADDRMTWRLRNCLVCDWRDHPGTPALRNACFARPMLG